MIVVVAGQILGCAPIPQPPADPEDVALEAPAPLPRPPPMRPSPDFQPADPAQLIVRPAPLVQFTIGADGLGILDQVVGEGDEVLEGTVAVVEVTSWRPDGTVWDSTRDRRDPARFLVGDERVVEGWDKGVVGMRAGGVRQVLVPPALGFENGVPGRLEAGVPSISQFEVVEVLVPPTSGSASEDPPQSVGGFTVRDVRIGDGPLLVPDAIARIDYVGWLPDGTAFDTTWTRTAPFSFRYGAHLVRWEGAFDGMQVGGRREVAIPADRAFGVEGRPPTIPPDTSIVMTVDLRAIE